MPHTEHPIYIAINLSALSNVSFPQIPIEHATLIQMLYPTIEIGTYFELDIIQIYLNNYGSTDIVRG